VRQGADPLAGMKRVVNTVLNCHRWQLVINNQERRFAKFQEVSSYQTSPISYTQRSLFSSRRHLNMVVASGRSWLALLVLVMATAPAALGAHNNRKMLDISLGGECMKLTCTAGKAHRAKSCVSFEADAAYASCYTQVLPLLQLPFFSTGDWGCVVPSVAAIATPVRAQTLIRSMMGFLAPQLPGQPLKPVPRPVGLLDGPGGGLEVTAGPEQVHLPPLRPLVVEPALHVGDPASSFMFSELQSESRCCLWPARSARKLMAL